MTARRVGDLLIVMTPRHGAVNFDDPGGMIRVGTQQLEMLGGGLQIDSGIFQRGLSRNFGVLRDFEGALGNGPVLVEQLGAIQLDLRQVLTVSRQLLVFDGLAIVRERAGDVGAPDLEQQLAFLHLVAQPRIDFDDPAGRQRRHRHLPRNVRTDHAGYVQLRRGNVLDRPSPAETAPDGPP